MNKVDIMSNIQMNDFDRICRMCLKQDLTLINIFFSEVSEIITSTTKIQMKEGDCLPETICMTCMDKFVEFYRFKQLCENNDIILQSILILQQKQADVKPITEQASDPVDKLTHSNSNLMKTNLPKSKPVHIEQKFSELVPLDTGIKIIKQQDSNNKNNSCPEVVNSKQDGIQIKSEADCPDIVGTNKEAKSECFVCKLKVSNINLHSELYHPVNGGHYCCICSKMQSSVYGTVKQLLAHLKYHRQQPKFQCEHCKKWFRYSHQKKVHMRSHTGERPATCKVCDKTFADPRYLRVHLKSHAGIKTNICPICQKGFTHKSTLTVHLKAHSDVRAHMCTKCGKTFKHNHNLKIHMRLHTGEKPFSCRLCFSSFISTSVLSAHMLTHTDEKRFSCTICSKSFKRSGDLNIHMRCHTGEKPYCCTLCGNKYRMASHLREHLKIHSGEKNHVCEICSKAFYNGKALRVHKVSHAGEKTFHCAECNRSFVHNTSLYAHQRKFHRLEKTDSNTK